MHYYLIFWINSKVSLLHWIWIKLRCACFAQHHQCEFLGLMLAYIDPSKKIINHCLKRVDNFFVTYLKMNIFRDALWLDPSWTSHNPRLKKRIGCTVDWINAIHQLGKRKYRKWVEISDTLFRILSTWHTKGCFAWWPS